jgi:DNA-binding transcriptional ArsR family regulator
MTALPALVLSLLATTGACVPCAPADADVPEIPQPDLAPDDTDAVTDEVAAADVPDAGPAPSLPSDPLAVVDELTDTRLPAASRSALSVAASPAPAATPGAAASTGDERDEEPGPPEPDTHVPHAREPTTDGASADARPAWPHADGEGVAERPALLASSLLVGLAAVGLYHKLSKDRALEHEARRRILELLDAEPDLGTTDVADELDVAYRTARHHLEVLERFDLVARVKRRGRWRWARPEDAEALDEAEVPAVQRELLALLEEEPGLHLSELARRLDGAKATVKHHLDRLAERGAVRDERVGPLRRFYPAESGSSG